jgi:hypothetical protein
VTYPYDQLAAIGETLDATYAANATRIGQDIVAEIERRPSGEQRLARALSRIQDGTYTEPAYLRAAPPIRDVAGRYSNACGPADDLGRCSARYHAAGCGAVYDSSAVAGQPVERVEAYRDQLALASPSEPEPGTTDLWADMLHSPEPGPDNDVRTWLLHRMGEADQPAPEPRPDLPDVTALRATLGI